MISKSFDQIDKTDIDALIFDEEPENRNLDYKQELQGGTDSNKKEFLADVSSFANASGGYILYGISEKRDAEGKATGIPEKADGLSINADQEIKRMESLVRDGIEPRIAGCHIREIKGFSKGPVILVHIPKSWMPPHMVTLKGSSRFYSRISKGKYPLDIMEIRSAVLLSESLADRIKRFRDGRIARIIADDIPVPLGKWPKTVMHLLPIAGLDPTKQIDIKSISPKDFKPLGPVGGWNHRINFDGFLTYARNNDSLCDSYLQLYRNGAIETVESLMLSPWEPGKKMIPGPQIEDELISALNSYLKAEKSLGFEPPIFAMISLLGVKDYTMAPLSKRFTPHKSEIDRDLLILPDILVEDYTSDASRLLRPAFDAMWQATGFIGSPSYDESGNRTES